MPFGIATTQPIIAFAIAFAGRTFADLIKVLALESGVCAYCACFAFGALQAYGIKGPFGMTGCLQVAIFAPSCLLDRLDIAIPPSSAFEVGHGWF